MPTRKVAQAARRHADQQSARFADLPNGSFFRADVASVTAGTASDGNAVVKVTYRGEELEAADYPDSYTPVVGHRVLCVVVGMQLSILHHGIGTP